MKKKLSPQSSVLAPGALAPIQESCACYRGELDLLTGTVGKLNAERKAIDDRYLPTIQRRVKLIGENKIALHALVDGNRPLFAKPNPKSRIFSDIKVGLRKQPGRTEIDDPARTLELIKKHCPEKLDELAPSTRALSKEALEKLPADLLKKLGVEIAADSEKVIVEAQDSDIEKAVAALIAQFETTDQKTS